MASDAEAIAAGFLVPADIDPMRDGAGAIRNNARRATDLADNRVLIDGTIYQRTGVFPAPTIGAFSGSSPTFYQSINLTRPYAPPAGWGFVAHIIGSNRISAISQSQPTASPFTVTLIQFYNGTAGTLTLGWTLVKI